MNARHTFYQTLIVSLTLAGLYLLWQVTDMILLLLGAIIVASAIRPLVKRTTSWRIPVGVVILLIYVALIFIIGGLLAFMLLSLYTIAFSLISDALMIEQISGILIQWSVQLGYEDLLTEALLLPEQWSTSQTEMIIGLLTRIGQQGLLTLQQVGSNLTQLLLALVMSFYWLTARDKIIELILSITPSHHRVRLKKIIREVENTLGDYLRGTGLLMLVVGAFTFVGLLIIGVPHALALGLLAGLFEAIPMFGPIFSALLASLVAFSVSPTMGFLTVGLFMIIQFLENNVLVPRIMGQSLGLNSLVVLIAFVAGSSLAGIEGALFAIPVVAMLQIIIRYLVIEPLQEEAGLQDYNELAMPIFEEPPEEPQKVNPQVLD